MCHERRDLKKTGALCRITGEKPFRSSAVKSLVTSERQFQARERSRQQTAGETFFFLLVVLAA